MIEAARHTNPVKSFDLFHRTLDQINSYKKEVVEYSNGMVARYDKSWLCILFYFILFYFIIHAITLTWQYDNPLKTD